MLLVLLVKWLNVWVLWGFKEWVVFEVLNLNFIWLCEIKLKVNCCGNDFLS